MCTLSVQISDFGSLIVTCCNTFANAEKRVLNPQEISLLQSFFVLPEIKEIVSSRANTRQRVQWTLYTKQSKQGISQPVQNMQNTSEACAHHLGKEAWSCGGSQAPKTLSAKTEMELATSVDE